MLLRWISSRCFALAWLFASIWSLFTEWLCNFIQKSAPAHFFILYPTPVFSEEAKKVFAALTDILAYSHCLCPHYQRSSGCGLIQESKLADQFVPLPDSGVVFCLKQTVGMPLTPVYTVRFTVPSAIVTVFVFPVPWFKFESSLPQRKRRLSSALTIRAYAWQTTLSEAPVLLLKEQIKTRGMPQA